MGIVLCIVCGIIAFIKGIGRLYARVVEPMWEKSWLPDYKYAHRGLHGEQSPENSLGSIKNAMAKGYAVEVDVKLTRDGRVVVFHDRELERMTGVGGKVGDFTLDELKALRLDGTDERIPTLEEVLELVDGRVPILFEIKNYGLSCRLEKAFYNTVRHYRGKYAVQSFSPYSLRWFRKNAPHVPRGQLACDFEHADLQECIFKRMLVKLILYPIKRLETNFMSRPHFISCEFHRLQANLLKHLREKGASVLAWTIRTKEQFASAEPFIDSVIFERFLPEA